MRTAVCLLAGALLLGAAPALGFEGYVTQDTTWTTDMTITGDVIVLSGATLTIVPGVTVTFTGPWWLRTEDLFESARIVAQGCLFTATTPQPGSWQGIGLNEGGASRLEGCEIEYASTGCLLVRALASEVVGCQIHDNLIGIASTDGLAEGQAAQAISRGESVAGCVIADNQVGIETSWGHGGRYEDNQITGNTEAGVRLGDYSQAELYRNVITGNGVGIHIVGLGLGPMDPLIGGAAENANEIHSNNSYDFQVDPPSVPGPPPEPINAEYNDWGPETTLEMIIEGYPSDIEAIYDCWDDPEAACVDYLHWIIDPQETPAAEMPNAAPRALGARPNPFRARVEIHLGGAAGRESGGMEILDASGRLVRQLRPGAGGPLVWDGRDETRRIVPGGIYFCRSRAGGQERTIRIVRLD